MKNFKKIFNLSYICLLAILVSCSSDDADNQGGPGSGSDLYANFELSGGGVVGEDDRLAQGLYVGGDPLVSVITTSDEEGASVHWSTYTPTSESSPFWKLDFITEEYPSYPLTTGTYTLGNFNDASEGNADFGVVFISEDVPPQTVPYQWGGIGDVQGTVTITEIERGVLDNGLNGIVSGTFELTLSGQSSGSVNPPLNDIVITNGEFRSKLAEREL